MKISKTPSIGELLQQARQQLQSVSDSALLDAQLLLAHCLKKDISYLLAWPEVIPEPQQQAEFQEVIKQRATGIPVAYLIGHKEFWSLPFAVTPDVLIPRPETELLVEQTLEHAKHLEQANILELGTGSGAIAITLAKELPQAQINASDISEAALDIARLNAQTLGQQRITFLLSDWFSDIPANTHANTYDIIVSNPPYITAADKHLKGTIRHEPLTALASGADGLDAIRVIIKQAKKYLIDNGLLLLEHGFDQGRQVRELLGTNGYVQCQTLTDYAGNERVTMARKISPFSQAVPTREV